MPLRVFAIALAILAVACEKPSHENVDKWTHTEHGEGKLESALKDESLDPDLAAHAGANLLRLNRDPVVWKSIGDMAPPRRAAVAAKLAGRLWEAARVDGELVPGPEPVRAKDGLVELRKLADEATRAQIDTYLLDWYCVPSYEARATRGAVLGPTVIRLLGAPAGKKLMPVLDAIVTAPANGNKHQRVGDELLLALAVSGDPAAVKYLVDLVRLKSVDQTLPERAMTALYRAYIDPQALFDVQVPDALAPNIDALVAIARDPATPPNAAGDALKLVRTIGPPRCIAPLVGMVGYPHPNPRFKLSAADSALKCGGAPAIHDVVDALPNVPYERDELFGAVVADIVQMPPAQALPAVRALLAEPGRIPRWVAIEALAAMKSTADAHAIAAISSSEKLLGYWGDQSDVDPKNRKAEPTLGQRAKELAAGLK